MTGTSEEGDHSLDQRKLILDVIARDTDSNIQLTVDIGTTVSTMCPERSKTIDKVMERLLKKVDPKGSFNQQGVSISNLSGEPLKSTASIDSLEDGSRISLGEVLLLVQRNVPSVRRLALPPWPMVNSAILPTATFEFANSSEWKWYRVESERKVPFSEDVLADAECVAKCEIYVPQQEDIGFQLVVCCTPVTDGRRGKARFASVMEPYSEVKSKPVKHQAESCIVNEASPPGYFWIPHEACKDYTEANAIRLVTYNLLADYNIKRDIDHGCVFYTIAGLRESDIGYRRQRLLQELKGYHADIYCLQEVDRDSMYHDYFHPHLSHEGYDGIYLNKSSTTPLGNAIFWRQGRLQLIEQRDLDLTTMAQKSGYEDYARLLDEAPELGEVMEKTTTVANLVLLRMSEDFALCVANVHLYGHPQAPHVRILQASMILRECQRVAEAHQHLKISVIFCGDFNCGPHTGACEFLSVGHISQSHADWVKGAGFGWGRGESRISKFAEGCPSMSLSHPFKLANGSFHACPYTYISEDGRSWCCDQVYHDTECLRLLRALSGPQVEDMSAWTVPSSMFPSDHIAVVVELERCH
eukprot:TRINITY_DN48170_c0_g1_i1.p1 TRINITY_DN48170_c0_g1~~TRINITY_DN48170_c0_g1_i1.p1  ORF type:complete len:605 (-),score=75.87 TRINITY_DN48170_c0_g1_i1:443-2194(-)